MATLASFCPRIALGTVQLGVKYGITNHSGQPTRGEAFEVLDRARLSGINTLDTARMYGESEQVIGDYLSAHPEWQPRVTTKIPPLAGASASDLWDKSVHALRAPVHGLLLHRISDLLAPGGDALWSWMESLQERGQVTRIGVSATDTAELEAALKRYPITLVQVPANVLDRRFLSERLVEIYQAKGVELHVRSVFLQGVLFQRPDQLPDRLSFAAEQLARARKEHHDLAAASLACVLAHPMVSRVVLGFNSPTELREMLQKPLPAIAPDHWQTWGDGAALTPDPRLVDPWRWS